MKLHPLHHYNHGCRCIECVNMNRVYEAMKKRKRGRGWLVVKHDGILERRYPEMVLDWIRAKGQFG